jgi:hypothetical protein
MEVNKVSLITLNPSKIKGFSEIEGVRVVQD